MAAARAAVAEPLAEPAAAAHITASTTVRRSLERLWKRYGKYAVDADVVRAELDEQLGDRTLSGALSDMRGK